MNTSDYPDILKELKEIPCTKIIINYMPYPHPHNLARDYFLDHPEYTHLIVMAHDCLVTKQNYEDLIKTVLDNPEKKIIAAVCNVERAGHPLNKMMNICFECPSMNKNERHYSWIPFNSVSGLIKVGFQGNAFTIIERSIIERYTIEGAPVFQGTTHRDNLQFSGSPDITMCNKLKKLNIDIWANTEIKILHYANHLASKTGTVAGFVEIIPDKP